MRPITTRSVWRWREGGWRRQPDQLATEEPLTIILRCAGAEVSWLTTMRTPGADTALAVGLLLAEGLVRDRAEIVKAVEGCPQDGGENQVTIELTRPPEIVPRSTTATAACGICGRQAVDDLMDRELPALPAGPVMPPELLADLPARLRKAQKGFAKTGGLHAAGWFTPDGELRACAEDVGRHNAVDKVVGAALLAGELPPGEAVLVVSGRLAYELVVKARVAGFPVLLAVGAPTSLAVELAEATGVTILGFAAAGRLNVYAGAERVQGLAVGAAAPGAHKPSPLPRED